MRQFETSVLDDEEEAGALGLTGVPAFVANRKAALTGAQPVKNLECNLSITSAAVDARPARGVVSPSPEAARGSRRVGGVLWRS